MQYHKSSTPMFLSEKRIEGYPHFFAFCEYFFRKNFSNKKILINIV